MTKVLLVLSILSASVLRLESDFNGYRHYLAVVLAVFWISAVVWKRVNWSAGLAVCWTLLSAAHIFGNPFSPYIAKGDIAVITFDSLAACSFISILLVLFLLLTVKAGLTRIIVETFGWLCILDSWFVVIQFLLGHSSVDRGGFFGNASINACVIAFTYPVLKRQKNRPQCALTAISGLFSLVLPVLAILLARSNMALASIIAALLSSYIIRFKSFNPRRLILCVGTSATLVFAGHCFMGDKFGENSGRFILWKATMKWWWQHASHWTGTGLGTYFVFGPNVQLFDLHQTTSHMVWMHNDWLQILFEQGFVGITLIAVMTIKSMQAAVLDDRLWIVASMVAYSVTCLGNFPMHLPVPGFFGALLVVIAFDRTSMSMRSTEKVRS